MAAEAGVDLPLDKLPPSKALAAHRDSGYLEAATNLEPSGVHPRLDINKAKGTYVKGALLYNTSCF